jgi:hypothetical protein
MDLITALNGSDNAPAYAWPGGYPIFYLCADGETLCPVCVNREIRLVLEATLAPGTDTQWEVEAVDVNWEDDFMQCAHCNKFIDSAYGDSSESPGRG